MTGSGVGLVRGIVSALLSLWVAPRQTHGPLDILVWAALEVLTLDPDTGRNEHLDAARVQHTGAPIGEIAVDVVTDDAARHELLLGLVAASAAWGAGGLGGHGLGSAC